MADERLAFHLTLEMRLKLLSQIKLTIHLSSSGGNFGQFPLDRGFSQSPGFPGSFRWPTFLRHRFLIKKMCSYYP